MKSKFSKTWNSSKQPRKQRKFVANAPNHIKRKLMGASLDKVLRTRYGMRSVEVRKGDEVKIMRGKFAKKHGKVGSVDIKRTRIQIDGVQRAKKGGEKVETWFHPSNVKIIVLYEDDNRRLRRRGSQSKIAGGSSTKPMGDSGAKRQGGSPQSHGGLAKGKAIKTKVKEEKDAHKEN